MASHTVSSSASCNSYGALAVQQKQQVFIAKQIHFSLDKKAFHSHSEHTQYSKTCSKINALSRGAVVLEPEATRVLDLAPHKLLSLGENGATVGIVREVSPLGLFVILPNGRDGYLPALDLGISGGLSTLERFFRVGQELIVRVVRHGGGGREILSTKKPEFAPNTDPRFIFLEKSGFAFSTKKSGARINGY